MTLTKVIFKFPFPRAEETTNFVFCPRIHNPCQEITSYLSH